MTLEEAERLLLSLELFGMRFGLDRMRRLLTVLGSPQERFAAVHVVGTNGKSSTVRMTAAILRAHGLRTGAYLSPHLVSFTERVRVDDADVSGPDFAAAVQRAARAAQKVDRTLEAGDVVTQFELLTAAAFDHFARAGVDVAVVEAGLGGRYDATNVLDRSRVQVLTNVGLEHTRWLGPTIADIAGEKLDVVREGATLVVGADLAPDAARLAEDIVRERHATLVVAPAEPAVAPPTVEIVARGAFQRRNFALALEAARVELAPRGLDADAIRAAAASTLVPGRFEVLPGRPGEAEVVFDGAHNPGGLTALAEALPEFVAGRRLVACLAVLEDKNAAEMLRILLPLCDAVVITRAQTPRALSPATLVSLTRQLEFTGEVEVASEPRAALERARALAGPGGVALATGSIYLIADLLRPEGRARSSL